MKKSMRFSLPVIAGLLIAFFLNSYFTDSPREQYEKFLLKQMQEVEQETAKMADLPKPGQPEMAAIQDYFMTLDPAEGRVPLDRLKTAWKQTRELQHSSYLQSSTIPLEWNIVPSNMGGRTRCITIDPNIPGGNKIWAGSVTGGLWYNDDITNQLSAWIPVDDFWSSLSVSCIEFDPLDPQIMYVGTGEAFTATTIYRESSGLGVGIFKSTDGGQTWNLLPSTEDFKYVTDMVVKNENGTAVVYAGVVSGVYKGENHNSLPSDGLYRSFNGGETWLQVLPDIPGTDEPYAPADIEVASNGRMFIGTKRNIDDEGGATILYSDSGLIGSWTIFDDYVAIIQADPDYYVPGRVILAAAPSDPNVVYALFGAGYVSSSNGFTYSRGRHIARTEDGGTIWSYRPIPSGGYYFWATLAWHALGVEVDPNNPDHVYIGGLDTYKSTNGGSNWNQVSDWRGMYYGGGDDYVHADIHDIDFKPGSSDELLISTDGGVFYTNEATNFEPAFQEKSMGFGSLQFYTCDIYPVAGINKLVGGLQDNGTEYYTGSPLTIFDMIGGGDGAYCWIDDNEPQIMIISVYYNQYTLFMNENWYESMSDWSSGVFINPSDYDFNENAVYANACSFGGSQANYILRISGIPYNINGNFINLNTGTNVWFSHVKYSPHSQAGTATIFVGTLSGSFFKAENVQSFSPQVTEITGSSFPEANISCVAIGGSEDTLLVTFSNYGVSSVWQTYDGGQSWEEKETNLPDMPVRWALYHPYSSKYAMLATETGIWTTDNLDQPNTTWSPDVSGLANVRVDMLQMRMADNTVVAATHGRGLAYVTWDISTSMGEEAELAGFSVYPNPSTGVFRVSFDTKTTDDLHMMVFNTSGQKVFDNNIPAGTLETHIDLSFLSAGEYILKIDTDKVFKTQKILIRK